MSRPPPLPVYILKSDMAAVNCLDYLFPNLLCASSIEGKVHLWDLEKKREKHQFKAGTNACLSISIIDSQLVSQEKGGIIHLWCPSGGDFSEKNSIKSPYVGFCKLDLGSSSSNQDSVIFAPAEDSSINIISLKSLTIISSLKSINEKLGEIMVIKHFEMEGLSYLLSAYESGHIYLWDLKTRKCLSEYKIDGTPMDLDFDPQKKIGVCGTESKSLSIFKLDSGTNLSLYRTIEITNAGVSRTCIRHDGKILALGCWDGRVRLYSWKTLKPLAVLLEHKESIHDVYFVREQNSPVHCSALMAVASKDQCISLWDVYNQ